MKIQILQENLSKALVRTGRIISAKTQLPVLQNVLVSSENGICKITTTNLETTLQVTLGVKEESPGSLCIPAKTLTEFVTSLPQETVTLEEKDGTCVVSTTRARATIPVIAGAEFPPVKIAGPDGGIKIPRQDWSTMVSRVIFAAATDEGRPLLTGIKIKKEGDGFLLAATDGYRLSLQKAAVPLSEIEDAVIPARALSEVQKMLSEGREDTDLLMSKSENGQLAFRFGDTVLETRLIDGEYVDFQRIIPKIHTTSAVFDREVLLRAVKTAAIFARDSANIIRLSVSSAGMTVSANTPQVGEDTIDVDAAVEGEDAGIAFNSRFLVELLNTLGADQLSFEMTGALNPGVFKIPGDESFLHIIMPVRVQG